MKKLFLIVTAVASLTIANTPAKAFTLYRLKGQAAEQSTVVGVVTHVHQAQRSFTVDWKPTHHHRWTYELTVRVTDRTFYKNGSWANVVPGEGIVMKGSGDTVDYISFIGDYQAWRAKKLAEGR